MSDLDTIRSYHPELTAIRRDIHAHPEIGFEERRTSDLVARELEALGLEVHRNIGRTGVVGVLRRGNGGKRIGLRADMDALPMDEQTNLPYRSQNPGRMHACGHDGHTTMLLGAARYLAAKGDFHGTVHFIFQPAEEGLGGAQAMLDDKLFERFPCDFIFGMHNRPGLAVGKFMTRPGAMMAGGAFFDITVTGRGTHGARPEGGIDPVLTACHITAAIQSIVSRTIAPTDTAVVSVTRIETADAYNVIPQTAKIGGTARAFQGETMTAIEASMKRLASGIASGFGATAETDFRKLFAPTINDDVQTADFLDAARAIVGPENVDGDAPQNMASEDFSAMLEVVPGAYLNIGNGTDTGSVGVHNPGYDFNDEAIPYGVAALASIVERKLKP
ncbi:MAG TPA: M20 aminoacylase family protein [Acetobacteraceae bacterium]|jgi:hippurate hydrolase|nr:M20 aminoacylase family protein [Acetobacteraceae bacterium]